MKPTTLFFLVSFFLALGCEVDGSVDVRSDCGVHVYARPGYVSQMPSGIVYDSLKVWLLHSDADQATALLYPTENIDFNVEKSFLMKVIGGVPAIHGSSNFGGGIECWAKVEFLGHGYSECPSLALFDLLPGGVWEKNDVELVNLLWVEEIK